LVIFSLSKLLFLGFPQLKKIVVVILSLSIMGKGNTELLLKWHRELLKNFVFFVIEANVTKVFTY